MLINGGPLDITWAKSNDRVFAIIECFFPGQTAGDALRKVLYNEDQVSNPAARMPATWPMTNDQVTIYFYFCCFFAVKWTK